MTTDQKRKTIISWWETATPPNNQAEDNGRFIDIISGISADEIDVIYDYVFNYVVKGTRPVSGSVVANAMQTIITNYQIFT